MWYDIMQSNPTDVNQHRIAHFANNGKIGAYLNETAYFFDTIWYEVSYLLSHIVPSIQDHIILVHMKVNLKPISQMN